jgi:hypothetical protein
MTRRSMKSEHVLTANSEKPPLFIVGTPRSGTTLTATIVGKHPAFFMPGETHYFEDIYARRATLGDVRTQPETRHELIARLKTLYRRYAEFPDQDRIESLQANDRLVDRVVEDSEDYEGLFRAFMTEQMYALGKQRWGNNVPRDIFCLEDVLRCCPAAKVLVCIRDPRDFLFSYQGKWKIADSEHMSRLQMLYHPVVTTLLWMSTMRAVKSARERIPVDQIMLQKYEDLVTDPDATVRRLCAFVDVDFNPEMLEVSGHNSSEETDATGIFAYSVGRWTGSLPADEVSVCQLLAGKLMRSFGYGIVPSGANPFRTARHFVDAPLALYRALKANAGTRGPLKQYLFQRVRFLLSRH